MGKATSKLLDDKIRACDPTTGPLESHFRQFSKEWRIEEVVTLHRRLVSVSHGALTQDSRFDAFSLLAWLLTSHPHVTLHRR